MAERHVAQIDAPFGPLSVAATERGVCGVRFGALRADGAFRDGTWVQAAVEQLGEYLDGRRSEFDVPLDWGGMSGARKAVLLELCNVSFGTTVSYGDLAQRAGIPGAAQLVGQVMASNPLPVIVPCHRVTRTGGALGGFAGARHAVEIKSWLLAHEGARLL